MHRWWLWWRLWPRPLPAVSRESVHPVTGQRDGRLLETFRVTALGGESALAEVQTTWCRGGDRGSFSAVRVSAGVAVVDRTLGLVYRCEADVA